MSHHRFINQAVALTVWASWLALSLMMSSPSKAGTISSGGGLIFGNEINPWFLENTTQVSYCIDIDEVNFGATATETRQLVGSVLNDWKEMLGKNAWNKSYSLDEVQPFGGVHLATQTFVEEVCSPSTDLRFQFGTLSATQMEAYTIRPQSTIAVTVRTHYDEVQLRGKGFIYVGPQQGPLHFASGDTVGDPWSYCSGCLLRLVLTHELGHVFGLGHEGSRSDLMGEQFVDYITQKPVVEIFDRLQAWPAIMKNITNIFSASDSFELIRCEHPLDREFALFLGTPNQTPCIKAELRAGDQLLLYRAETKEGPFIEIGHSLPSTGGFWSSTSSLIHIKLNLQQQVFTKFPKELDFSMIGPARREREKRNANFVFTDGSVRPISYKIKPGNGLDIMGAVDDRIFIYDATP